MTELPESNVEEMRLRLERWRADEEVRTSREELDERRRDVCQEMPLYLDQFINGEISLDEFKITFDRRTRSEWDVFGQKGMSGAMFLNTLVKHIDDQEDLEQRLRELVPVPATENIARRKMADFYDYLMGLIDAGELTKR